jgi:glycosyltransferase involved in cell wall biosynthesis
VRICLVYDCVYPHTVGGAERWYRSLAERLAAEGHEVDYLTLRQWPEGEDAGVPGVNVLAVGPRMELYRAGRRRTAPPLRFGFGVLLHLIRHGRRYDVVHTASFPYFSLLAAGAVRPFRRYRIVVDWHELWTRSYWREYLGRFGDVGWRVQRLCLRIPQRAFCFSRLHERRLRDEGYRGELTVLRGQYAGDDPGSPGEAAEPPTVVFAGRHIPEKRVPALVPAIAEARKALPDLRGEILGDGPERSEVERRVIGLRVTDAVEVPGFVSAGRVEASLRQALCLVLPSRREGYGLVVVEASARGTPSVVVDDPDNAAVELIEEGVNGTIAASARPEDLAAGILRIHAAGPAIRASTAAWFAEHRDELSLERSLATVLAVYGASGRT